MSFLDLLHCLKKFQGYCRRITIYKLAVGVSYDLFPFLCISFFIHPIYFCLVFHVFSLSCFFSKSFFCNPPQPILYTCPSHLFRCVFTNYTVVGLFFTLFSLMLLSQYPCFVTTGLLL